MNNSNPNIEPRLSEYIRKKKYFEENNIKPSVPLEKQYSISSHDLTKIRKFISNNTSNNESSDDEDDPNYIEYKISQFPSTQIKDKRLERITQKIKKDRDANIHRHNINDLKKSYDMFTRDVSSTTSCDFTNEFTLNNTFNENNDLNNDIMKFFEKNTDFVPHSNTSNTHELIHPQSNNQYNVNSRNDCNKQYNEYMNYNQNKNLQNSIGMGYKKHESNSFHQNGRFDVDNKINIPSSNNSKKSIIENIYDDNSAFGVPMKNIDYENYVKYGNMSSKSKSLGFDNVCNNHFQFIDSDIQDPTHVVNDRPISARLENRQMARPTNRKVFM